MSNDNNDTIAQNVSDGSLLDQSEQGNEELLDTSETPQVVSEEPAAMSESDSQLVELFGEHTGEMLAACEPADIALDYVDPEIVAAKDVLFYYDDRTPHTVSELRQIVAALFDHAHKVDPVPETPSVEEAPVVEPVQEAPLVSVEQPTEITPESSQSLTLARLRELYAGTLTTDALAAWDRDTLMTYHLTRGQPTKTARGNWPSDLRRTGKMDDWTPAALADWLDGLIVTPKGVDEEIIWEDVYSRYRLPNNWTHEAAKVFIDTAVKPAYTVDRVLVEDRMRDMKPASHWTHLELRSALLGHIESPHSKEELVESLKTRLNLSKEFNSQRLIDNLAETPTESSMDNTLLKSTLEEYKITMSKYGKNLSEVTAGKAQTTLYKAIRRVMARDIVAFHEGWTIISDFINENYNLLFKYEIARRGYSQLDMSKSAALTFEDLMTLLIHTRAPNTRAREAKQYNLTQIMRYVPSEAERNNVIHFYQA